MHLPLRSVENEWGPGQVRVHLCRAGRAGSGRQSRAVSHRDATDPRGWYAPFRHLHVPVPAWKSYYSSGWHLHQSLTDSEGQRRQPVHAAAGRRLPFAARYAFPRRPAPSTPPPRRAFATPTVNGLSPVSAELARSRPRDVVSTIIAAPWCACPGRTRGSREPGMENRMGEPAANPYLYVLAQIVAGLDGVEGSLDPGPSDEGAVFRRPAACCRRACPLRLTRSKRDAVFRASGRRGVRRLFPRAQAQRSRPLRRSGSTACRTRRTRRGTPPTGSRTST